MVWGSLRADDLQGLLPETMELDERGFCMDLARSKTKGPDKRTHTVKVFVERQVSLTGHDWIKKGVALWKEFDFRSEGSGLGQRRLHRAGVSSATVALYMRKALGELKTPKRERFGA